MTWCPFTNGITQRPKVTQLFRNIDTSQTTDTIILRHFENNKSKVSEQN